MRKFILLLIVVMSLAEPCSAKWLWVFGKDKNKQTQTKPKITPYEKLFKDKIVESDGGLMKIHKVEDKIYVEFPLAYLSREMMITSSIESISDAGEGYPGQLGGRAFRLHFTKPDSVTLQSRVSLLVPHMNSSEDRGIDQALSNATTPGIFKSFKILAYTPDSSAVVVDMKDLLFESSTYTKPFPANAANSYYGFVSREHKLQKERSRILSINASDNSIGLRSEMSFLVDHVLMGSMPMYDDVPLTSVINKMLVMLPETPMQPRFADSRIGVMPILKTDFESAKEGVKNVYYARKWRIEPRDEQAYKAGELTEVVKPIRFYIDTLMPNAWHQYIREGIVEWNKAFERIGFKNVIQVEMFPADDSLFNANSLDYNTIRFAPTWFNSPQVTMHADSRSGEILNTSIGFGANVISISESDRMAETMAVDERVRANKLPSDLLGDMLRINTMKAVGECLGFSANRGASSAYPVDSLRSVTFTHKYGLTGSVMDEMSCNLVARPSDVKAGVLLVNNTLGEYDYDAVKWLYKPIESTTRVAQDSILDSWIKEFRLKPYSVYVKEQQGIAADPRTAYGAMGDDYIKWADYSLPNIKHAYANYFKWYAKGDKDYRDRKRMRSYVMDLYSGTLSNVMTYVGGIYVNDVREGDGASYVPVSKARQKQALNYVIGHMKDMQWLNDNQFDTEFEISDDPMMRLHFRLFESMFNRLHYVEICGDRSDDPYTADEFLTDIYNFVWSKTLKGKSPDNIEKQIQTAFLASIIEISSVTSKIGTFGAPSDRGFVGERPDIQSTKVMLQQLRDGECERYKVNGSVDAYHRIETIKVDNSRTAAHYYSLLLKTRDMLRAHANSSVREDRLHYQMLLYRIDKALKF